MEVHNQKQHISALSYCISIFMLATILHQMQLKKGFMESCVLALQYGKHERKEQQAQIETKLSMLLGMLMLQQDFQLFKK